MQHPLVHHPNLAKGKRERITFERESPETWDGFVDDQLITIHLNIQTGEKRSRLNSVWAFPQARLTPDVNDSTDFAHCEGRSVQQRSDALFSRVAWIRGRAVGRPLLLFKAIKPRA